MRAVILVTICGLFIGAVLNLAYWYGGAQLALWVLGLNMACLGWHLMTTQKAVITLQGVAIEQLRRRGL